MKIKHECLACLKKQIKRLANKLTDNEEIRDSIIQYGFHAIETYSLTHSTLYITGLVYDFAREATGVLDPYKPEKDEFNSIAEELIHRLSLREMVNSSKDALDTAVRLSIAGNIIDFSIGHDIKESDVRSSIDQSLNADLFGHNSDDLRQSIDKAKKILVLGDNAGEIVFDKLLIEQLPLDKVTYVVKGGPIVNDATLYDAESTGMDQLVRIIDSGAAIQGMELSHCSEDFIKEYNDADLIISKGQANYESLCEITDKPIYFLLRAKCQMIANIIDCPQHNFVLLHNQKIAS